MCRNFANQENVIKSASLYRKTTAATANFHSLRPPTKKHTVRLCGRRQQQGNLVEFADHIILPLLQMHGNLPLLDNATLHIPAPQKAVHPCC